MTLKTRISLYISLLFTVLFGLASTLIFVLYSNFRQEEFRSRLENKALSTIKLLAYVEDMDNKVLKILDQNSINQLYDEKTLVFDSDYKLIYSSIDDAKITWSEADLRYLKTHGSLFKQQGEYEIYGVFFDTDQDDYYALIAANDANGRRKMRFLQFSLIISYLFFTALCWIITSYIIGKLLRPLTDFIHKIKNINENNLDTRVEAKSNKNEIDLIANEFNFMMDRIELSYKKQKEFTAHASHELRTPLSRMTSQLENKISDTESQLSKSFLKSILVDVNQVTELIHSLLTMSKLDDGLSNAQETHRIDELIFTVIEKITKTFSDFVVIFNIEESEDLDALLEVNGNSALLEIAINNILKNAYFYSDNRQVKVTIKIREHRLVVAFENSGVPLTNEEQKNLFQPFMRGKNTQNVVGFGLGLRIVDRVLTLHNAQLKYSIPMENTNVFEIIFRPKTT